MFTISKSEIGIIGLFPLRLLYCFGRRFDLCGLRHQGRDAKGVLLPPLCSLSFFLSNSADPRSIIIACWPGPPLPSPRRPQDDRIQGNNASNFRPIINTREGRAGRPRGSAVEKKQSSEQPDLLQSIIRSGAAAALLILCLAKETSLNWRRNRGVQTDRIFQHKLLAHAFNCLSIHPFFAMPDFKPATVSPQSQRERLLL